MKAGLSKLEPAPLMSVWACAISCFSEQPMIIRPIPAIRILVRVFFIISFDSNLKTVCHRRMSELLQSCDEARARSPICYDSMTADAEFPVKELAPALKELAAS